MKRNHRIGILLVFGVLLMISLYLSGINLDKRNALIEKQRILAEELGVRIDDYPYQSRFPQGYLYANLKPGMTIAEAHNVLQGYKVVLNCGSSREVYYFLDEGESALRFQMLYSHGILARFEGEDSDSNTIFIDGCLEGQISE